MAATEWMARLGGRLAYSVEGAGPLVVCIPGLGDVREEYRFLTPRLVAAGYRVAALDLRSHGESSTGWRDLSPQAIGRDALALIRHLDAGSAVVIGTEIAAAAAIWAAAEDREAVSGIVLIGPFARDRGSPAQRCLTRALYRALLAEPWGRSVWMRHWESLFAVAKPADFNDYASRLRTNLAEPERFAALRTMLLGQSWRAIEERMPEVDVPALVVMGARDRDVTDPAAAAGVIAGRVHGAVAMVDGAGHYPHVECPDETAPHVIRLVHAAQAVNAA